MKKFFFFLFLMVSCHHFSAFSQTADWQISLQRKWSYTFVPHSNGDDDLQSQINFELGIDKSFHKNWGVGLVVGYNRITDNQLNWQGSYSAPGSVRAFAIKSDIATDIMTLKLTPFFRLPLGKHALTFRPAVGWGSVWTKQTLQYDVNDNGTATRQYDYYLYETENMLAVGLAGEYAYHFSSRWAAFMSVGYDGLLTQARRYEFLNTEIPLENFSEVIRFQVSELRNPNDIYNGNIHRFGNFTMLQLGLGVRLAL